jgi:hypothetical protein
MMVGVREFRLGGMAYSDHGPVTVV